MRVPAITVLISLAALAAPAALAQSASQQQRHYYITPTEMLDVYGSYPLPNGEVLRISREHRRYWAEMASTGRMEIVPVGPLVFEEKGASMRFTFTPLPFTTEVSVEGLGGSAVTSAPPAAPTRSLVSVIKGELGK